MTIFTKYISKQYGNMDIKLGANAIKHFSGLLSDNPEHHGIYLQVDNACTLAATLTLHFADNCNLDNYQLFEFEQLKFFVPTDPLIVRALQSLSIDFVEQEAGGEQIVIHAPYLYGSKTDKSLFEQIVELINIKINPQLQTHGGSIELLSLTNSGEALLQFKGGCQGCSMAWVTLKSTVTTILQQHFPQITAVIDKTEHAKGTNPYYDNK